MAHLCEFFFGGGSNFCKQIPSQRKGSFSGNSLAIQNHPRGLAAKGQQHSHNTAGGSRVRTLASGCLNFESWPYSLLASPLSSLGLSYSSCKMGILRQSRVALRLKLGKYGKHSAQCLAQNHYSLFNLFLLGNRIHATKFNMCKMVKSDNGPPPSWGPRCSHCHQFLGFFQIFCSLTHIQTYRRTMYIFFLSQNL